MVTRFYTEEKAKRVYRFNCVFQQRLDALLKTRTDRELELKKELDAITTSYVDLKCKKCNALIRVKYVDWLKGKFKRTCKDCVTKQLRMDLDELHKKIQPLLPEDYEIKYDSYYNATQCLAIRKKKE